VYCICQQCTAVCAATEQSGNIWEVTICRDGADSPCLGRGAAPALPMPATTAPVAVPPRMLTCSACGDELSEDAMVACANNIHHMCAAVCFPALVASQVHIITHSITVCTRSRNLQIRGAEDQLAFKEAGYRIVCKMCAPDSRKPYNMQQLGSRLPSNIHQEYTVACAAEQIEEALKTASPSTVNTLRVCDYLTPQQVRTRRQRHPNKQLQLQPLACCMHP